MWSTALAGRRRWALAGALAGGPWLDLPVVEEMAILRWTFDEHDIVIIPKRYYIYNNNNKDNN